MVKRLIPFLLVLLIGCQQTSEPIALDDLAASARSGDTKALVQLIDLLGEQGGRTNDRVYALLLDLGDAAIPALLPEISGKDRVKREYVIAALGNLNAAAAVPEIARVLADQQLGRRYIAAWALGEIGGDGSVGPLIKALTDGDEEVRKYATRSLIKLNLHAVDPLIKFLQQPQSPQAEACAVRALGDIANIKAFDVLVSHLNGPSRAEVVTALGKLKDPRAVGALVSVLHDPDWQIRMNAATALGPIGSNLQAPQLETLLDDNVNVVREWAARSLEMMTGRRYTYRNEDGKNVKPYNIYH
ncbi:HEAT repeat domain-containing protein [Geopsychrobacter electrodiphilus]|uniref:HEAT repeat domain-containing protein n=1 Tax=Geopsychrobacter electrodiphilus TaxID=225196 RepID=UPI0003748991|nr:HEAT repeat domain-containing protein [Geopsychrobacter electrodiphilus]